MMESLYKERYVDNSSLEKGSDAEAAAPKTSDEVTSQKEKTKMKVQH